MNETLKVGEEVTMTTQNVTVRVEFGPYKSVGALRDAYVVQFLTGSDQGTMTNALASVLKRRPRFSVGDAVVTLPLDTPGCIAAGPFQGRNGKTHYVVKATVSGNHVWLDEAAIRPAPVAPVREEYVLAGIRWDLDAVYVDSDGDAWEFNGLFRNGVPLMDSEEAGRDYQDRTLTSVINSYGPLTKRV
ncbi:phiSA1p31-related protein [Streptomyces platensis]|uniref:phiSA1p31-related protein n=1 Tax=Streptomyces platensis TaxID=58346 RepID=UPI002ED1C9FF|nr:phiSA1p31-related protein [Streptomyces platensis]